MLPEFMSFPSIPVSKLLLKQILLIVNGNDKIKFAGLRSLFKGKDLVARHHLVVNYGSCILVFDALLVLRLIMVEVMVHFIVQSNLFLYVLLTLLLQNIRHIMVAILKVFMLRLVMGIIAARNSV